MKHKHRIIAITTLYDLAFLVQANAWLFYKQAGAELGLGIGIFWQRYNSMQLKLRLDISSHLEPIAPHPQWTIPSTETFEPLLDFVGS